jgi:hypothetical protein
MSLKKWMHWAAKAFVNDCSVGLALIVLGFTAGMCFNALWVFIMKLLMGGA